MEFGTAQARYDGLRNAATDSASFRIEAVNRTADEQIAQEHAIND